MRFTIRRLHSVLWAAALVGVIPHGAGAQTPDPPASCPQGRIDRVEIKNGDVFDPAADEPSLLRWALGTANKLHIRTRQDFIRKTLLFHVGDCLDPDLLVESERLLSTFSFLRRVSVTHARDGAGGQVVQVATSDEWTTQFNVGVTYDAGVNFEWLSLNELNFLGDGIRLSASKRQYREDRSQSIFVGWPYLVRHTNIRAEYGSTPSGSSYGFRVSRPFVGDVGRHSVQVAFGRTSSFFSYGAPSGSRYAHVLIPLVNESAHVQYARRFGTLWHSWVVGVALGRQTLRMRGDPEYVEGNDFDGRHPSDQGVPDALRRQLSGQGATRLSLHLGTRKDLPTQMVGLDGVRDVQYVANGYLVAMAAGRSLGLLVPDSIEAHDSFVHFDAALARPVGSSYVRASVYGEADHVRDGWRSAFMGAELVTYARASWLPNQTVFLGVTGAGGWRTAVPFQLTLGGRDGIRSLPDEAIPGGRRLIFTLEDRIRLDWPAWQAVDLGATIFGDVGKMWAGDAPLGVDSPWQAGVGFGLRIGVPRGTRIIWRPDIAFPAGRGGSPVFRITLELHSLRHGFQTAKLARSMRFNEGVAGFF